MEERYFNLESRVKEISAKKLGEEDCVWWWILGFIYRYASC